MIRIMLTATLFAPLAAQAQNTGKWEVKVAPAECSLFRGVQGDSPALLGVRTAPGTDEFAVVVSGKDVPDRARDARFTVQMRFDGTAPIEATATPLGRLAAGPTLQVAPFKPAMLDSFAAARSVSVGSGTNSFASFEVPRAASAVAALRQCIDDQLAEWGADPAQFAPGGTRPVALKDRDHWLSNGQLMGVAATSSAMGIDYLYHVVIAADGSIESCRRDEAKANDPAEKAGCTPLIGQRLFTPAKNPAGAPVKGAAAFRVMVVKRPGRG
ncbi:hypothetical protein HZY97_09210 [Sphingomonas sp. R-74633]|uniref:hypothetical protein n=1 Tax=Sphingomonas sp. R-74633 TaxID=2751188 RepID=UPI0015D1F38D|nr:hypothetical protein [Sphingomonas sp. R-74633]NYT40931.1 hypothetical protein [Sphingomonas sp. R-74633]